ncbi:MAG: lamin tail domain-containing protein [Deltaproteobacteria bacterium]|nr:lamin tail domain-containing protein [Deltaproteobacteria bacterium]
MQHRFARTAALAAPGLLALSIGSFGCGDGGYQCGPGTMAVSGVCLPEELDARRPPPPDGGIDMGPPVLPDLGPTPPPPPPDLGPPPDPDMGPPPPPIDMGPPPPPIDMGPPPDPDLGPPDMGPPVDMSIVDLDMGLPDTGPMDSGPMDMGPPDTGPIDSGPRDTGPATDAGPGVTTPVRLLMSRVIVGGDQREAIEIYNPNDVAVDLSRYFITNFNRYGERPGGVTPPEGAGELDFIIRFPGMSVVAPRSYVVVARSAVGLAAMASGATAQFEITNSNATADMVSYGNAMNGRLSNSSDGLMLFYWDEATDLVTDIDYVRWRGSSGTVQPAINKTGISVDGSDPGTTPSTYATDMPADSMVQPGYDPTNPRDHFLVRCDYTEGSEARRADANGFSSGGMRDDETSEPIASTWRAVVDMGAAAVALGTVPTAAVCPGGPTGI